MRRYKKYEWNPYKSKWKAALEKNLDLKLKGNENILYLGASAGTTVSQLSKETKGIIFAVEKSFQMAIPLIRLSEKKKNIAPVFCDARNIIYMKEHLCEVNPQILFQDIPSNDQVQILKNASTFVDEKCKIFLSLKTQSISQGDWKKTVIETKKKLEESFVVQKEVCLEPFHKKHYFFILKKRKN